MTYHWINSPEPSRVTPSLGPIVWHFTSADGLFGILSSDRFWVSEPTALNDTGEIHYGLRILLDEWSRMRESASVSKLAQAFVDGLLAEEWRDDLLQSVFLLSTSKSSEIAAQWLNYSTSEGYAIGIERRHLWWPIPADQPSFSASDIKQVPQGAPFWLPVQYDEQDQRRTARDVLGFSVEMAGKDRSDFVRDLLRLNLSIAITSAKHPAFASEQEVRMVVPRVGQEIKTRTANGRTLRYTELARYLGRNDVAEAQKLPIAEVVCPPSATATSLIAVRQALDEAGHANAMLRKSELPLR